MPTSLSIAIEHLYAAFADMPKPRIIRDCGRFKNCCISDDEVKVLLTTPLRNITTEQLYSYMSSVLLTIGEKDDFLYLLPRALELFAKGESWIVTDFDMFTNRFKEYPEIFEWLQPQMIAIDKLLLAFIKSNIEDQTYYLHEDILYGVANLNLDVKKYFKIIEANDNALDKLCTDYVHLLGNLSDKKDHLIINLLKKSSKARLIIYEKYGITFPLDFLNT